MSLICARNPKSLHFTTNLAQKSFRRKKVKRQNSRNELTKLNSKHELKAHDAYVIASKCRPMGKFVGIDCPRPPVVIVSRKDSLLCQIKSTNIDKPISGALARPNKVERRCEAVVVVDDCAEYVVGVVRRSGQARRASGQQGQLH